MIDLYTWITDNGYKGRQALEESGLPYKLHPVNLPKREPVSYTHLTLPTSP
jgi:GST-like protein